MKQLFLQAPDSQLDGSMKVLISERWDNDPTALQLLEVIDKCTHAALASEFTMKALSALYQVALRREGRTHEELEALATWRTEWN